MRNKLVVFLIFANKVLKNSSTKTKKNTFKKLKRKQSDFINLSLYK